MKPNDKGLKKGHGYKTVWIQFNHHQSKKVKKNVFKKFKEKF